MDTSTYSFLDVQLADGVALVRFTRPSWVASEERELFAITADLQAAPDVRAVVLTGTDGVFVGGGQHTEGAFDPYDYYDTASRMFGSFVNLDKPLVIAANGDIQGSGLSFTMLGDIVVAERHIVLRDAHVLGGFVSATGSYLWPPAIGLLRSKRYLLTGDPVTADEAERMGLVNEVVDTGASLARAQQFAAHLASLSPAAVQGTKRALNQWLRLAFGPVMQHGLSLEFMRFPTHLWSAGRPAEPPK